MALERFIVGRAKHHRIAMTEPDESDRLIFAPRTDEAHVAAVPRELRLLHVVRHDRRELVAEHDRDRRTHRGLRKVREFHHAIFLVYVVHSPFRRTYHRYGWPLRIAPWEPFFGIATSPPSTRHSQALLHKMV